MKNSKEHNLEGFGCLGGLFFALILAPGIALIALLLIVLDPSQDNYRGVQLIIVLIYVPFLGLLKWSYSRRLKAWSFAADSLGLLLSREYGFGYFTYSLEGEYKGYSIRAWDVWGGADSVGRTVFILKCPESLRQRVKDGEIGGVVGTVQGKPMPWYAYYLPDRYGVFVEDGDFRLNWKGLPPWMCDVALTVEQMADLVASLEHPPASPAYLPEPPPDE